MPGSRVPAATALDEEIFRILVRSVRDYAILALDPDGRIISWNEGAERIKGYSADEIVGQSFTVLYPEERVAEGFPQRELEIAARDGRFEDEDWRIRKDGSRFWANVVITALRNAEGELIGFAKVTRDLTQRREDEHKARQHAAAQAARAEAEKLETVRTLSGGVAHEINNTMMVVLGLSQFLLNENQLSAARRDDVLQIQRAADRAATVARQLLSYSRRSQPEPQAVPLDATLDGRLPMFERMLGAGRRIETSLACPGSVWIDPGHLEQILSNLVLNARDAMAGGGTLTIATRPASRDGTPHVALIVRDTGTGMDAETRARIFEPFFTTKPPGVGSGLGLSVIEGLIEQSGGHVGVESMPGEGTTFTIHLPLMSTTVAPVHVAAPPAAPDEVSLAGSRVLVVDDEPAVRQIAARTLQSSGCSVLQAADGAAAIELVDRHGPPDLVLTDLMLGGMDGAELARRLRDRWPTLPIVFMSGYSETHLRRAGALDDSGTLMEKPFTPQQLVQRVYATLTGRPA
ncbi:MAG TPA: ATP-binding protein [Gemmatimonadales bacterium]|nr:ATP-binding protein [Gemmatimonadales bacterium]